MSVERPSTARLFEKNSRFAHFGQKLAIWLDVCTSLFKDWESLKNLKVGVFETDFNQVHFVFRQTTCTYSESWGLVENLGGQKMTQKPKFVSKIFPPIFA